MQFALLLLFNVFIGAVLYLVISLKLERSASEFRERRLRKEMDEIIREFNLAAERNISILESRIRTMRRLLEKNGDIRGVDVSVDDGPSPGSDGVMTAVNETDAVPTRERAVSAEAANDGGMAAVSVKKSLLLLFERCSAIFPWNRGRPQSSGETLRGYGSGGEEAVRAAFVMSCEEGSSIISREIEQAPADLSRMDVPCPPSEEEIRALVEAADDRYSLVALLHERGCPVDEISRCSGIPAGEVRLVLNLNSSR